MKPLVQPVVRRATRADIEKYYKTDLVENTMIAKVGLARGRMYACWGLLWENGRPYIFMDIKPTARRYKVRMLKEAYKLLAEADEAGIHTIYANRAFDESGSGRLLEKLGFEPTPTYGIYKRGRTWDH